MKRTGPRITRIERMKNGSIVGKQGHDSKLAGRHGE